mgnify:CR=1 FL=1
MKKRITGDYGIHDYFKYYDSIYCEQKTFNAYNVGEKLYKSIIRDFLGEVNDNIIHNNFEFKLPSRLGTLSIKKFKREFKTDENGKIITKFPVDWKTTKDLWEKNPEAKKNKKLRDKEYFLISKILTKKEQQTFRQRMFTCLNFQEE